MRKRTGVTILAVRRAGVTTPNPSPDFRVRPGDELLVLASAGQIGALRALFERGAP